MLRMNDDVIAQYNSTIRDNLGRLWDAFQFIKLASEYDPNDGPSAPLNNQVTLSAIDNKIGVEGVTHKADLLQTRLQETQKTTTNAQILSSFTGA